jgi:hypothetical protein
MMDPPTEETQQQHTCTELVLSSQALRSPARRPAHDYYHHYYSSSPDSPDSSLSSSSSSSDSQHFDLVSYHTYPPLVYPDELSKGLLVSVHILLTFYTWVAISVFLLGGKILAFWIGEHDYEEEGEKGRGVEEV